MVPRHTSAVQIYPRQWTEYHHRQLLHQLQVSEGSHAKTNDNRWNNVCQSHRNSTRDAAGPPKAGHSTHLLTFYCTYKNTAECLLLVCLLSIAEMYKDKKTVMCKIDYMTFMTRVHTQETCCLLSVVAAGTHG